MSSDVNTPKTLQDDRQLVTEVLSGDLSAFEKIVKAYQRSIYFLALRMVKNPELSDDITQKTFLKAYRALSGFQFKSSLKTWLSAIAINLCKTELMRPRRETVELQDNLMSSGTADPGDGGREADEQAHRRHLLQTALERLPDRQKEVVMLRIYQELPFKEIAQALDSTETAVKVNFHHAMKSLKAWISKRDDQ
jgi:RNA polymerase sigma-70 factor (ECF subfamily)